jgi:hypothetical protein
MSELAPSQPERITADDMIDTYQNVAFTTLGEVADAAYLLSDKDFEKVSAALGWDKLIPKYPELADMILDAQSRRLNAAA